MKSLKRKEEPLEERSRVYIFLLFILLLFKPGFSVSQNTHFNTELFEAHKAVYQLRIKDALQTSAEFQEVNPAASSYIRVIALALRSFISERREDLSQFEDAKEEALEAYDKLQQDDPYKRFFEAETYFYSAIVKAKEEELYSAARDIGRSHSLLTENIEKHPNFLGSYKTKGIMQVYLSTVPDTYQWAVKLLGFNGDLKQGLKNLERLVNYTGDDVLFQNLKIETHYMYGFALHHVAKQSHKAWAETQKATLDYKTSVLSAFFRASLATKLQKTQTAIDILKAAPQSAGYEKMHYLDLLLGQNLLYQQAPESLLYFKQYLANYSGQAYKKASLRYISWYYVVQGDNQQALTYKDQIPSIGNLISEDDKAAQHYSTKKLPHQQLLKARLQYDGGMYSEASKSLNAIDLEQLSKSQKAEYSYRQGRLYEKWGNMDVAIKYYKACSLFASESSEYYGPYACLYLAYYYFAQGDKEQAKGYYVKAQSYKHNKEYKSTIEQRAKLGLKKL